MGIPESFRIDDLDRVPNRPGLYAWYSEFLLHPADIRELKATLASESDVSKQKDSVRGFLIEQLFQPLEETPYNVKLSGRLKPGYEGTARHLSPISTSLVERLVQDPTRLDSLSEALKLAIPFFASPIYIGMAKTSLRDRLTRHRSLIHTYSRNSSDSSDNYQYSSEEERYDHCFAQEAARRFRPDLLWVYALDLGVAAKLTAVDAENILNRINYPLCGRN